jgi:hypothetical protein
MTALPILSSQDGPRITINDWLKAPTRVPAYVLDLMKQGFLVDAILRTESECPAGVVRFEESSPIYGDSVIEDREEFGEVPVGRFSLGQPNVAYSRDKAQAVAISDEMRDRNDVDALARRITQMKNTMIRTWDDLFVGIALAHPSVQTFAAASHWNTASYDIRGDILSCVKLIDTVTDPQGSEFGFECDTLIASKTTKYDLLRSKDFNAEYYGGNIADENLRYVGKLPNQIMGLDVLVSPRVPVGKAIFLQRKVAGFISDEKALSGTALYRDEPRKMWRSDFQRKAAIGLDQPKAIVVASNVA